VQIDVVLWGAADAKKDRSTPGQELAICLPTLVTTALTSGILHQILDSAYYQFCAVFYCPKGIRQQSP
jgi:hypothetical protein